MQKRALFYVIKRLFQFTIKNLSLLLNRIEHSFFLILPRQTLYLKQKYTQYIKKRNTYIFSNNCN